MPAGVTSDVFGIGDYLSRAATRSGFVKSPTPR